MLVLLLLVAGLGPVLPAAPAPPRLWLWAWDRPEDLRFLQPDQAGVAFFVLGIRAGASGVVLRPRTAPLRLNPGMRQLAVVRLEVTGADLPDRILVQVLSAIRERALVPGIEGLQLDFDAARSQRPLYRELLTRLRRDPALQVPLSITALASWCMGDPWLRDLPVASAVVMLFQMGPDAGAARAWLSRHRPLTGPDRASLAWGLGTDQPLPVPVPAGTSIFLFHPRPWTATAFRQVHQRVCP